MKLSDPGFACLQPEPREQCSSHFPLFCLQLRSAPSLQVCLIFLKRVGLGAAFCIALLYNLGFQHCVGLWVRACRRGQWSGAGRGEDREASELLCTSSLDGGGRCSVCLPMAQLFANLSPPPPAGLRCTLPPRGLPLPLLEKKNHNNDLIWLSLPLLPRPTSPQRETAV